MWWARHVGVRLGMARCSGLKCGLGWINVVCVIRPRWWHLVRQALTKPPEEPAGEADGKEQPDLIKALLGSRQETALQQLLEKFLAAEGGHCEPPRMDGQMDRPVKVGTHREPGCPWGRPCSRDGLEHSDFSLGLSVRRHGPGGLGEGVNVRYIRQSHQLCVCEWESGVNTHSP